LEAHEIISEANMIVNVFNYNLTRIDFEKIADPNFCWPSSPISRRIIWPE